MAASTPNLINDLLGQRFVGPLPSNRAAEIINHDHRPFGRKLESDTPADTSPRPGHDSYFAFYASQIIHPMAPCSC
jgi:hypothetical protein